MRNIKTYDNKNNFQKTSKNIRTMITSTISALNNAHNFNTTRLYYFVFPIQGFLI